MSKIVVMDSGFGGLTVLKELMKSMPDEEYIYYGDSANAPYGDRPHDELLGFTSDICGEMIKQHDVGCFVIACNTTTSEVWDELTDCYKEYDFVGIEPALKWAVEENPGKRILVLATSATIGGRRLRARYDELKNEADIILLAAPNIVPAVEGCTTDSDEFAAYLDELIGAYAGRIDCVVLGCTHFPFVKENIRRVLGKNVVFYDAAVTVAKEVMSLRAGRPDVYTSGRHNVPVHYGTKHDRSTNADIRKLTNGVAVSAAEKIGRTEPACGTGINKTMESRTGEGKAGKDEAAVSVLYLNSDPSKTELEARLIDMYSGNI